MKDRKNPKDKQKGIPLKILTLGDSTVGKSSILVRYTQNKFHQNYLTTVGIDYQSKSVNYNNKKLDLQIWDSAGQEKYQAIFRAHYQKADGMILMYSVIERFSFDKIQDWINSIKESSREGITIFLISNKNDYPEKQKEVTSEEGKALAKQLSLPFYEITSKDYSQVAQVMHDIVKEVVNKDEDGLFRVEPLVLTKEKDKEKKKCNC